MDNFQVPIAGFLNMGPTELVVILLILLLLFGGSKLPGLAKGLGQSIKEFKKASREEADEAKAADEKKATETAKTHGSN
jgi:sec-independent protein translocase protein TatA